MALMVSFDGLIVCSMVSFDGGPMVSFDGSMVCSMVSFDFVLMIF